MSTSKSTQGHTELTLLAPIKPGLAPKPVSAPYDVSHGQRLSTLLTALLGDRRRELEANLIAEGLLEELQVIHSVQWLIFGKTEKKLLLAVTFDGPWEPYIRVIVERGGPLLDMIFAHCVGFDGSSCADGYPHFSRWVREHQITTEFLFAAHPQLTTEDIRFLEQAERTFAADPGNPHLARFLSRTNVVAPIRRGRSPHWHEKVIGLHKLGKYFDDERHRFDRMAALILQPEFGVMDPLAQREFLMFQGLLQHDDHGPAMAWFQKLPGKLAEPAIPAPPPAAPVPLRTEVEDRQDVQGSLLTPYFAADKGATHGCLALLRFRGRASAQAFLRQMVESVTTEPAPGASYPDVVVNLGLTYAGLQSLRLDPTFWQQLPREFQEGLAARAGMLGDIGRNSPRNWQLPRANWPAIKDDPYAGGDEVPVEIIDAVLTLQMRAPGAPYGLLPDLAALLAKLAASVDILHVQPTARLTAGGHFKLEEGFSQPAVKGDPSAAQVLPRDQVAPGELLLGYHNQRGELPEGSDALPFKNSSFMALRMMSQDVDMYHSLGAASEIALGRQANGVSLETPHLSRPEHEAKLNDFTYPASADESRCPLFAHVRRANPRNDDPPSKHFVPRILRRGMSYGPRFEDQPRAERGLMFVAYVASLADQFEVVQRWVNAGNSSGALSTHPDLIAGPYPEGSGRKLYYSNALGTGQFPVPAKQLTALKWGLYAWVPSRSALGWLVDQLARPVIELPPIVPEPAPFSDVGAPPNLVKGPPTESGAYGFEEGSVDSQLKVHLEGTGNPADAAPYWLHVLSQGGVRRTPFGALVGSRQAVAEVLLDAKRFSVRGYWGRMVACQAESFLGMDPDPVLLPPDTYHEQVRQGDHARDSGAVNAYVAAIREEETFELALAAGRKRLADVRNDQLQTHLDLNIYARHVIRDVGTALFQLPDDYLVAGDESAALEQGQIRCPFDLTSVFLHIFPPRPSATVTQQAVEAGPRVAASTDSRFSTLENTPLIQAIRENRGAPLAPDPKRERRLLLGALSGFAVPTYGHLLSTLVQVGASNALWRLQREHDLKLAEVLRGGAPADQVRLGFADIEFLRGPMFLCMILGAVPERIHRTATVDTTVKGLGGTDLDIEAGDLLAVSIAAAALGAHSENNEYAWKYLFGDLPPDHLPHGTAPPVHRCPAQSAAIGVILGALLAVLEHRPLTKDPHDPTLLKAV